MNLQRSVLLDKQGLTVALGLVLPLFAARAVVGQTIPILDGEIERVYTTTLEPGWLEGPVYDGVGGVWFSELLFAALAPYDGPSNVSRFDIASGTTELKMENTGGADGLAFDADRNLIVPHVFDAKVTSRPVDDQGNIVGGETVLADNWQGEPLTYPNDMVIDEKGGIYFTDPDPTTFDPANNEVYYISPTGELQQVSTGIAFNNGIGLSPDGQTLYVVETGIGVKYGALVAFDVNEDGSLDNQRVFTEPPPADGRYFAPDGMTVDRFGNVFSSDVAPEVGALAVEPGLPGSKVRVFDPTGVEILTFEPPEGVINLAFAPPDGNMLYFTSEKSLWRVPVAYVPEPSTLVLLISTVGTVGLLALRRRRVRR